MTVDSKGLGRLTHVADPREVWLSESGDFTPWLAENLDVLADELGMTLNLVGTEVLVGPFRLDVKAEDDEGRTVIIENQLEKTDHSHLGQCLVYAAGLEASTVIWVSREFRDDFRRALDWLNERTDQGVQFFGVEVGVVQISETGPRAPVFEVVSRPNDWAKEVKSVSASVATENPRNSIRQDVFQRVVEGANATIPALRVPARNVNGSWVSFAGAPFGHWAIAQIQDSRFRVEAYLDCGDAQRNAALLDQMSADAQTWCTETASELIFESLEGKRACRIGAHYGPVDVLDMDESEIDALVAWGSRVLVAMFTTMDGPLRERAHCS